MSYEILYRKCVFQLPNGWDVFGIEEVGSNNTYDYNNKRVRWRNLHQKCIGSKQEIEAYAKSLVQSNIDKEEYEVTEQNWKTVSSQYWASIRSPGKGTMQQLISFWSNPNVDYDIAKECLTFRTHSIGGETKHYSFDEFIEVRKNIVGWISVEWCDNALYMMKRRYPKKPKSKATGNWAIQIHYGQFIVKLTRWWLYHTQRADSAKKFKTEQAAMKRADEKIKGRFNSVKEYKAVLLSLQ